MLQHLKLGRGQLQQLCWSQPYTVTLLGIPILTNHLQSQDRLEPDAEPCMLSNCPSARFHEDTPPRKQCRAA